MIDKETKSKSSQADAEKSLQATPINREDYSAYGNLIAADEVLPFKHANMKTAKRFNHLCDVENRRPEQAELNLCLFRCSPLAKLPLDIKLLERHPHSTQVFLPMTANARFLVIVCLGGDTPDLATLKAFEARNGQGISYKPGIWHYPMTAIEHEIDFACLIWEDETDDDCEIFNLPAPLTIDLSG